MFAAGFQKQDFMHLQFPSKMYVDYVRVYQREDVSFDGTSCDPPSRPTAEYIQKCVSLAEPSERILTWRILATFLPIRTRTSRHGIKRDTPSPATLHTTAVDLIRTGNLFTLSIHITLHIPCLHPHATVPHPILPPSLSFATPHDLITAHRIS